MLKRIGDAGAEFTGYTVFGAVREVAGQVRNAMTVDKVDEHVRKMLSTLIDTINTNVERVTGKQVDDLATEVSTNLQKTADGLSALVTQEVTRVEQRLQGKIRSGGGCGVTGPGLTPSRFAPTASDPCRNVQNNLDSYARGMDG